MDSTALRVVCVLVALCAVAAQKAEVAPSFEVSLDAPAMTRWDAVIQHFHAVYPAIEAWMDKLIPEWLQSLLAPVFADIDKYLGPYADELRGIAQTSGMELGKVRTCCGPSKRFDMYVCCCLTLVTARRRCWSCWL